MLDESKISQEAAEALYMGIVHDTGVFRHSCTSPETLEVAAKLMRKGVRCNKIINDTYYDKTYYQNQILGRALLESVLLLDGKIIFSAVRQKEMHFRRRTFGSGRDRTAADGDSRCGDRNFSLRDGTAAV